MDEKFASVMGECVIYMWWTPHLLPFVYYESRKREMKVRLMNEGRCDERLQVRVEESTRLTYTGFLGGLEHLKIETRLIDKMFPSVMGECVFLKW